MSIFNTTRKFINYLLLFIFFQITFISFAHCGEVKPEIKNEALTEKEVLDELNSLKNNKIYHGSEYDNILNNGFDFFLSWVCESHKEMYLTHGGYQPSYLNMIAKNVNEEHKQIVLECFKDAPQFINVIERKGWLSEASVTLLKHIKSPKKRMDTYALAAFIRTAELQHLPILIEKLKKSTRAGSQIVKFLSVHKSRSEIKTIIEATWKNNFCANCYDTLAFTPVAISYGVSDALRYAVFTLDSPGKLSRHMDDRGGFSSKLQNSIRYYTNYNGDFEDLVSWYRQSAATLTYDEDARKFLTKK